MKKDYVNLWGSNIYVYDHFRNFSIDELFGNISWDKIRALTETFSKSKTAISIEGKQILIEMENVNSIFNNRYIKNKCILCNFICFPGTSDISSFKQGTCMYPVTIQGTFKYLQ